MKIYWNLISCAAALVAIYLGSYFALSRTQHIEVPSRPDNPWIVRIYPCEWMTRFYRPASNVEGLARDTFVLPSN